MTLPVWQSHSEIFDNNTVNSVVVAKPAGLVAGESLIAALVTRRDATATHSAPTGWSQMGVHYPQVNIVVTYWKKLADGSEPSSYTFSWVTLSARAAAVVARISGANFSGVALGGTPGQASIAPAISPAVTTTLANSLILRVMGKDRGNDAVTMPDGSHTTRFSFGGGSTSAGLYGSTMPMASTGSTGTASFSFASRDWVASTIVIPPAATSPPPPANTSPPTLTADGNGTVGTWTNAVSYIWQIRYSIDNAVYASGTGTDIAAGTLSPGSYYLWVQATNAGGSTAATSSATVVDEPDPPHPLLLLNAAAMSPAPKTIRITGTSDQAQLAVHVVQIAPGVAPDENTPAVVVPITPGQPFSFDVAVPDGGDYRVDVRGAREVV